MEPDDATDPLGDLPLNKFPHYEYPGALALVSLHERHMQSFIADWRRARELDVELPVTDDPNYRSLQTLLHHVIFASAGYLFWICRQLNLPDPKIDKPPSVHDIEKELDDYVEHLLLGWRRPLQRIPEDRFFDACYVAPWGPEYCIDAMLEHAAMHPMRHSYQLRRLMAA